MSRQTRRVTRRTAGFRLARRRRPPLVSRLRRVFQAPATTGNYSLDPHYHLPYVEVWNLDVQKTLPWGIVMNVGYNGSKGNHLDITSAPRATPSSPDTNPTNLIFNYEQAAGVSNFNAGTLRVNKRLSNGIALGANYQYSHAIDNAGALGGNLYRGGSELAGPEPRKGTRASTCGTR